MVGLASKKSLAKLLFTDLGGQEKYKDIWKAMFKGTEVAVLAYEKGSADELYDTYLKFYSMLMDADSSSLKYVIPVSTKMDLADSFNNMDLSQILSNYLGEYDIRKSGVVVFPAIYSSVKRDDMRLNLHFLLNQIVAYHIFLNAQKEGKVNSIDMPFFMKVTLFGKGAVGKTSLANILIHDFEGALDTKLTIGVSNSNFISVKNFLDIKIGLKESEDFYVPSLDLTFKIPKSTYQL